MLERELSARDYLAGDSFSLADTFLLPVLHYMRQLPETKEIMSASPHVTAWYDRMMARPSVAETVPSPPGRGWPAPGVGVSASSSPNAPKWAFATNFCTA